MKTLIYARVRKNRELTMRVYREVRSTRTPLNEILFAMIHCQWIINVVVEGHGHSFISFEKKNAENVCAT